MWKYFFFLNFFASPVFACETALVLSMDVSNSIDRFEFRFQTDGLADALMGIDIMHVLIRDHVALTVVQWSGEDEQIAALPWQQMNTESDIRTFSENVRLMDREFIYSKTALGDALAYSIAMFDDVPDCHRRVIDVSGDGVSNVGSDKR